MSLFLSAGDASGDLHAAALVRTLERRRPGLEIAAFGGPALDQTTARLLYPLADNPIMGFRKVIGSLRTFMGLLSEADRWLEQHQPELVVLVDYPGFNVNLARLARRRGIPTLYYICPQYWGWAPWRLQRFGRAVDEALVIFPFEESFFAQAGVHAEYIGHPVADHVLSEREQPSAEHSEETIAILAGSRRSEVEAVGPWLMATARLLRDSGDRPRRFVTTQQREDLRDELHRQAERAGVELEIQSVSIPRLLRSARLALVTSGTATLECALSGVPSIVLYRVSRLAKWASKSLLLSPYIAQPNLLLGEEVFPEFLATTDPSREIAATAESLMADGPARDRTLAQLNELRQQHLQPGAAERAADRVLSLLEGRAN